MPAPRLKRSAIITRLIALLEQHGEADDVELDYAPPHTTWEGSPKHIQFSKITGRVDNARFGRPNPSWNDEADVEIWIDGFGEHSQQAAERAEEATSMLIALVSENRQLALADDRLDGVQSSWFTELDGPTFLGTDQGVISSYRVVLHVQSIVRTEG